MKTRNRNAFGGAAALLAAGTLYLTAAGPALAQSLSFKLNNTPAPTSQGMYRDSASRAFVQNQKAAEREIKRVRFEYIRRNNPDLQAEGFKKLEKYTAPSEIAALMSCLREEGPEVQKWLIDHISQRGDQSVAQATLAYLSIYDPDAKFRSLARAHISGAASERTRWVVEQSLASADPAVAGGGSGIAFQLRMVEAIPAMIQAQSQTVNTGSEGDVAWIAVGTQRYFVSDLTPVVGEGSAGFDPTITPLTEGTVVEIRDAYAISYRYDVHTNLVNLIKADTGQDVEHGFDKDRWYRWYRDEYLPTRRGQAQPDPAASPADPSSAPSATPAATPSPKGGPAPSAQPVPGRGKDG